MKTFLFLLAMGLIATLAITLIQQQAYGQGGVNVNWTYELSQPEAQKAVGDFVQSHCDFYLWMSELNAVKSTQNAPVRIRVNCMADAKK